MIFGIPFFPVEEGVKLIQMVQRAGTLSPTKEEDSVFSVTQED